MSLIRPEVQELIKRGNITLEEYKQFSGNSWEYEAIVPALDEEAFLYYTKHLLKNCFPKPGKPAATYDEAVVLVLVPELLKRYMNLLKEVHELRDKTGFAIGVGDGSGNLFVYGDYTSITRVQKIIFDWEKFRQNQKKE